MTGSKVFLRIYLALGGILFSSCMDLPMSMVGGDAKWPNFRPQNILAFLSKFFVGRIFSPAAEGFG
jgi:hypothetical protein